MANENRYYKTPFAESGDKAEVPDESVGGAVGYDTGFGSDYALPQEDANRKRIERDLYNGMHNGITKNLKQWQESLYPTWIEDNGDGVAYSYPAGMIVNHLNTNWISTAAANQEEPGTGVLWGIYRPIVMSPDKKQWPTIANGADTDHDIVFSAGSILDSNGVKVISNIELTKRIDAPWSVGNGTGGLFSGTVAANETYHCHLIMKQEVSPAFTNLGSQFGGETAAVACSTDGTIVYVVDEFDTELYRSTDSGVSFTNLGSLFSGTPEGVACSADGTIVYVVDAEFDELYRSTDSGVSFTNLGAQFGSETAAVACSADGTIVYVVDSFDTELYRSSNSGVSFTNLGVLDAAVPIGVACSADGTIVYVVDADFYEIFRSTDSGVSFTNLGDLFSGTPAAVACSTDGTIVYVVDTGSDSIYRSTDSGVSFTNLGAQFSTAPEGVACSADGTIVYVIDTALNSLYRSTNSGVPDGSITEIVNAGFSTSATAADIPAGYTEYRRIGSVMTDGSADIVQFFQKGDRFTLKTRAASFSTSNGISGTTDTVISLDVPTGVPNILAHLSLYAYNLSAGGQQLYIIQAMDEDSSAPTTLNTPWFQLESTIATSSMVDVLSGVNSQAKMRGNGTSTGNKFLNILTFGWTDDRT